MKKCNFTILAAVRHGISAQVLIYFEALKSERLLEHGRLLRDYFKKIFVQHS